LRPQDYLAQDLPPPDVANRTLPDCREQLSNCQVTLVILTETMIGKEVIQAQNHEHEPLKMYAKMLVKNTDESGSP
jgi:hypothetical protein